MKFTKKSWGILALTIICMIAIPAIIFTTSKAKASTAIDKKIAAYGIPADDIIDISKLGYDFKSGSYGRIITTKKDMAKWKAYLENPKHEEDNYYITYDKNNKQIREKKNTNDPQSTDWYYIFRYDRGEVTVNASVFGNWIDPTGSEMKEFSSLLSYPVKK
ncbi:hypothetical protein [Paenilisteria rocourtiae]|uniref:Uncharacterized protein n=2 Tax=Listeria rocourtiae TaxID=647910 RepID=A0A4V6PYK6_9LIST|nr:hypothetical protein [Listeria rocourtiae]MBC1435218.1 hypothetical protein [Listeria rocourtiae]TDR51186.1 hypothetical protein DFP96_11416 [Listeria rocourtiae]